MEITKICKTCKISKPHFLFRKWQAVCIDCINEGRRLKNKENPAKSRNDNLRKRYGITSIEYDQMYLKQKGLCLVCELPEKLYVDHCHNTKKVRGLLCNSCNLGLGHLKDNIDNLKRAIKYLRKTDGKKK